MRKTLIRLSFVMALLAATAGVGAATDSAPADAPEAGKQYCC